MDHAYSCRNFDQHYAVELATRPQHIREAKVFRYEVFCRERGILPGDTENSIESDEYDANARHVILREVTTGTIIGTTRLVLANRYAQHKTFPMQRVCGPMLLRNVPISTTAEISRFALSKRDRPQNSRHQPLFRLALVRGIVQASLELGLTHWCAAMETSLLRLLGATGIHLTPIGPLVEYCGMRQPVLGDIEAVLARGRRECPAFYDFVTQEGRLRVDRPARVQADEGMRAYG